ncbi:MAG: MtrB/PioB family outer membrane beta-barrel protein [Candidatus Schekmanbacteria bacterium]|nr:MtrB/PioB family outer membrane beta-barrel protein [Candidatus Schekmanbacteria bacterium]
MKAIRFLVPFALLAPLTLQAQEAEKPTLQWSGEITVGGQSVENDTDSAKFDEYRDTRDGLVVRDLSLDLLNTRSGLFFDLNGAALARDEQSLRLRLGDYGNWKVVAGHNEIPHDLSNKARTPFVNEGSGLFTVPSTVPLPNRDLTPNAAQLLQNDSATAAWLGTALRDTDLGPQRRRTSATVQSTPTESLKFRLTAARESKSGSRLAYGPIGDRPPRTLNIQFAQPIDFASVEAQLEAELIRPKYQAAFTYSLSDFANDTETLRWQNIYTDLSNATSGYDQWADHRMATFGQRALAPDSLYHNATLTLGFDLPRASRLAATAAYGWMKQDSDLLPYSTSDFGSTAVDLDSTAALPRQRADAEIKTTLLNLDYTINPVSRMNLQAFLRFYELDNQTPQDNWWYVTDDTMPGVSGADVTRPTFKNQRTNLAYSYDQMRYGVDTFYNFASRTSVGLSLARDEIDRDFRQANTAENTAKATLRTRPASWLTLRGEALFGDREGESYNTFVTSSSYWYDPTGKDKDNPKVSFTDHPDMRKSDVSDRRRNQLELNATVMPTSTLNLGASILLRDDDFDSDVKPTQPLLNNPFAASDADRLASTPGDQLGLLERETQRFALDIAYVPTDWVTFTAFGSREIMDSKQRGLEFDENHKLDPVSSNINTKELGSWTRASSQWMANTDDTLDSIGFGVELQAVPDKLRVLGDYAFSSGSVDVEYSGFGTQSGVDPDNTLPDNYQFAFRTPPTVEHDQHSAGASVLYQLLEKWGLGLHYRFDRYEVSDWMQLANAPWFESVGSEFFVRDTSSETSNQWGNRLVNLGSLLAPSYETHVVLATVSYRL